MLDFRQLKTFRTVVDLKNFTRAAAELGYSQSSVTIHIQALERELGTPLIERRRFSRKIVLTNAGRRVFDYAGRLLALAEEAKAAAREDASGRSSHADRQSGPVLPIGSRRSAH
jgi:DNA-binding transcriptional LysR family regulator